MALTFHRPDRCVAELWGGMIPLGFSLYSLFRDAPDLPAFVLAMVIVTGISDLVGRPVLRGALVLPLVPLAPLLALFIGWDIGAEHRTALTYLAGLAGILTGADVVGLRDLRSIGRPEVGGGAAPASMPSFSTECSRCCSPRGRCNHADADQPVDRLQFLCTRQR